MLRNVQILTGKHITTTYWIIFLISIVYGLLWYNSIVCLLLLSFYLLMNILKKHSYNIRLNKSDKCKFCSKIYTLKIWLWRRFSQLDAVLESRCKQVIRTCYNNCCKHYMFDCCRYTTNKDEQRDGQNMCMLLAISPRHWSEPPPSRCFIFCQTFVR